MPGQPSEVNSFFICLILVFLVSFPVPEYCSAARHGLSVPGSGRDLPFWNHLVFEDGRGLVTLVSDVRLVCWPVGLPSELEGFASLVERFVSEIRGQKPLAVLVLKNVMDGLFVKRMENMRVIWFEPESLRVVARLRWNSMKPGRIKLYRWEKGGVRRWKITDEDAEQPEYDISGAKNRFYACEFADCSVSEAVDSLMFLLPCMWNLPNGELNRRLFLVFGKKYFHRVVVNASLIENGLEKISVSQQGRCRIFGQAGERACPAPDLFIRLQAGSTDLKTGSEQKKEGFSFLGLNDGVIVEVNKMSGLPLVIRGRNGYLGDVMLRLKQVDGDWGQGT